MIYIKHPTGNEEYAFKEDGKIKYIPIWTTGVKVIQVPPEVSGGARLADNR